MRARLRRRWLFSAFRSGDPRRHRAGASGRGVWNASGRIPIHSGWRAQPGRRAGAGRIYPEFFADEPVRIVYGAMRDKAVEEVTNTLFPLAQEVIVTAPDQPRALNPSG
jgi:hypothetical protein